MADSKLGLSPSFSVLSKKKKVALQVVRLVLIEPLLSELQVLTDQASHVLRSYQADGCKSTEAEQ